MSSPINQSAADAIQGSFTKVPVMTPYRQQRPAATASHVHSRPRESLLAKGNGATTNACVICLESMEKGMAALSCGHVFHHTCIEQALASSKSCPVCRHPSTSSVGLFLSFDSDAMHSAKRARIDVNHGGLNERIATASRLPERLKEMRSLLDQANEIQFFSSWLQSTLDESTRRLQSIQRELDRANAELKRARRIVDQSYAKASAAMQAKETFEREVVTAARRLLDNVVGRQHATRCSRCAAEWGEMKRVAQDFSTAVSGSVALRACCCVRHAARTPPVTLSSSLPRSTRRRPVYDV